MTRSCRLPRADSHTLAVLLLSICATGVNVPAIAQSSAGARSNILVIIGDDMGVETLASFGVGTRTPTTATLDELAAQGVSFNNMWAQAMCSPTRATILTGRYGFRTGVGGPTGDGETQGYIPESLPAPDGVIELGGMAGGMAGGMGMGGGMGDGAAGGMRAFPALAAGGARWGISLDEFTLTQALATQPDIHYDKAAIGKWHLADVRNGWQDHPNLIGFDHFSGLIRCCVESYFSWVKLVNGEFSTQTGYAVSDKVDDAIEWYDDREGNENPWLLWLAFNTPHNPIHMPPRELLQSDFSDIGPDDLERDQPLFFDAMIEAMDTEIGRLLDHIGPDVLANTYVLFIGDNGTGGNVVDEPFEQGRAKGSVYTGGIAVPFIVTGPGVPEGKASNALVNSTDLFATILDMAGIGLDDAVPEHVVLDSVSMMPYFADPGRDSIRETIYADNFTTTLGVKSGEYTIRNAQYKFLVYRGVESFFDLSADPYEHHNLLEGGLTAVQQAQYDQLKKRVNALHASEL